MNALDVGNDTLSLKRRYLQIGDQIETIIHEIPLPFSGFVANEPSGAGALCAFITVFQFIEKFTDLQAAEAVRTRPDWKYALHLPLSFDVFDPALLVSFREFLLADPSQQVVLQVLVDRLAAFELFASMSNPHPSAGDLITTVGRINQIVLIAEALLHAVETLVAVSSVQERGQAGPELYWKYAAVFDAIKESRSPEDLALVDRTLGNSILELFKESEQLGMGSVGQLPEFQQLRKLWKQYYDPPMLQSL